MNTASDFKQKLNICSECGGPLISSSDSGDLVCGQCGLIAEERRLDFSHSGRRAYTAQEKNNRERTGSPISILLPDMGLTTVIDRSKITNPDLKRASKWNTRMSWEKRNLLIATTELKRITSNLNLPDHVKTEAMKIYKETFQRKLLKGRSINAMVAGAIYYSCRKLRIPRTLQEILDESAENERDVKRCYAILMKELNLKVPNRDPRRLIPRYITELGLDSEVEQITNKILNEFLSSFFTSGKDPKGIVAGALYLACRIKNRGLTQREIAETVGVTEVTLRSRSKEISRKLNIKI